MSRVKRGVTSHAKHKKVYKAAKGFYGRRKNTIRAAKAAVDKAGQYAFRDRKRKKRTFRALWIQRLNAAVRPFGMTYSVFINGLVQVGHHGRPQGAVGSRDPRAGGIPGDRRKGQGRAGGVSRDCLVFSAFLRSRLGRSCMRRALSRPSTSSFSHNAARRGCPGQARA